MQDHHRAELGGTEEHGPGKLIPKAPVKVRRPEEKRAA